MSRPSRGAWLAAAALLLGAGCASHLDDGHAHGVPGSEADSTGGSTSAGPGQPTWLASSHGHFRAAFTLVPATAHVGANAVEVELQGADGVPVPGAALTAAPWMPMHGHGASQKPAVSDLGAGKYRITQVVYSMPGAWQLRVDVTAGGLQDAFVVPVTVP